MIRLVATDLDGTLLRTDKSISPRTKDTLRQVLDAGVPVIPISGRMLKTLVPIAQDAGLNGIVVGCNGAIAYDISRGQVVGHQPIAPDLALDILTAIDEAVAGVCFATVQTDTIWCDAEYRELLPAATDELPHLGDARALCAAPVTKMLALHPTISNHQLLEMVRPVVGNRVTSTHSDAPWVEISAVGVSKGSMLAEICGKKDIVADEVAVFGDMPNDLAMFEWAGWSVAMANADPQVKAAASEVTLSNDEDGLAIALERLVLPERITERLEPVAAQSPIQSPT